MRGLLIVWVWIATVIAGCDAASERSDHPRVDASEAGDPGACNCGGAIDCPGGNSIRCTQGFRCSEDRRSLFFMPGGAYAVCTREMGDALLERGFCQYPERFFVVLPRRACNGSCDVTHRDERYRVCQQELTVFNADPRQLGMFCATPLVEGSSCGQFDGDCHPVGPEPDLNLECRDRRCVRVPRPEAQPPFGESCGIDEQTIRAAGLQTTTQGACVISGSTGCFRQRLTQGCRLDEDCPAGWDCMLAASCYGVCLPREARRNPANLAAPCAPADAAAGDASEDAGDAASDAR